MKKQIIEALKRMYAAPNPSKDSGLFNLGLEESAFERVASLGETFIKDEAEIENFVKGAESLLKGYQSVGDKLRGELAEAKKRIAEFEERAGEPDPQPKPTEQPDIASIVAKAVADAVNPLNAKIEAFESKRNLENAVAEAKAKFVANEWVKQRKEDADDAWERTMELHEFHKDWTSDDIVAKAKSYFDKSMARQNIDVSKPFESGGTKTDPDFTQQIELLKMQGVDLSQTSTN